MSAVVDVKHKPAPVDHIVVRLSLTEARDLVAAYKNAHENNRYFFDIWGRLPELVNQVSKSLGEEGKPRRRQQPHIEKHPDGGYTLAGVFTTNMPTVGSNNVSTQP